MTIDELEAVPYLHDPPAVEPAALAAETYDWPGQFTLWLVPYEGRYYVWARIRRPDCPDLVKELGDEQAARDCLTMQHAKFILDISENVIAATSAGLPAIGSEFLYWANLADSGPGGLWLAVLERDDRLRRRYRTEHFDAPAAAVDAFAAATELAAVTAAALPVPWSDVAAAQLRFRARLARAGAARAELGDLLRARAGQARERRELSDLSQTAGIARSFLYRVLDGSQWTWPAAMSGSADAFMSHRLPRDPDTASASAQAGALGAPPPPLPDAVSRSWQEWIRLAVAADSKDDALGVAATVLQEASLTPQDKPGAVRAVPLPDGPWCVHIDLDLKATMPKIEPDTPHTRAMAIASHIDKEGVTWGIRENEEHSKLDWPPDIWSRRPGRDDTLLHPSVRAVIIWVSSEPATTRAA
jgi:hypothetical protein